MAGQKHLAPISPHNPRNDQPEIVEGTVGEEEGQGVQEGQGADMDLQLSLIHI